MKQIQKPTRDAFRPLTAADVAKRGWDRVDFVYVTGDAYVDHPSFGVAIISRVLEAEGFRVAILSQPDYRSAAAFRTFGRPRLHLPILGTDTSLRKYV